MKWNKINQETFISDVNNGLKTKELMKKYNISKRTVAYWKSNIKNDIEITPTPSENEEAYEINDDKKVIHKLKQEVKLLKKSIENAKTQIIDSDAIKEIVSGVKDIGFSDETPKWLDEVSKEKDEIVPVLAISDVHLGEVVDAEDVNFTNEYDSDIAIQRVNQCVKDFINIYKNKMTNYTYPGVVLLLPGDNITNSLHDLADTNDKTVINQIITAVNLFRGVIDRLQLAFGKVAVFAVSGNHGRLDVRNYTKTKQRYSNSLEKIVYHFVEDSFKGNDDVNIITSPSDIVRFSINGLKHQLEHGDSIKSSGSAIAGPITGWERARLKKSGVASATGNSFDVLVIGHFHQYYMTNKFIVCNSVKGYDEYCQSLGISYAPPGSTSYAVNSHGQIIFSTDIQCRDKTEKKETKNHIELF